ncbi:hypothetical protein [Burkholderia pseudomallei]|uniref:hypothetical protein n=1 Tax=Burkholderia pseudomallei TaxID=28450 RepID=UPI00193E6D2B|nr:hypothetical protein [Burkholderia pseudomallei]QRM23553.1 hypothetical protein JQX71_04510 [Burkholderia pseudomallei]
MDAVSFNNAKRVVFGPFDDNTYYSPELDSSVTEAQAKQLEALHKSGLGADALPFPIVGNRQQRRDRMRARRKSNKSTKYAVVRAPWLLGALLARAEMLAKQSAE